MISNGVRYMRLPMNSENAIRCKKRNKEKTMTYIISGILDNGNTFLMSDCVGTVPIENDVRTFKYINKTSKLVSCKNETYFSVAGNDSYALAINVFDSNCYEKNVSFDFKNENHITDILEIYKGLELDWKNRGHKLDDYARLYFIDKNDVYYYDIDSESHIDISILQNIGLRNVYLPSHVAMSSPKLLTNRFNNNEELIKFCKNEITENANKRYGIDLKDRFSYVIFEKEKTLFSNSIKNNTELILTTIGGSYSELK